jgi:hypothetical protein
MIFNNLMWPFSPKHVAFDIKGLVKLSWNWQLYLLLPIVTDMIRNQGTFGIQIDEYNRRSKLADTSSKDLRDKRH